MFVCLSVCVFFLHFVPIIASVTKLSMALLQAQGKAEGYFIFEKKSIFRIKVPVLLSDQSDCSIHQCRRIAQQQSMIKQKIYYHSFSRVLTADLGPFSAKSYWLVQTQQEPIGIYIYKEQCLSILYAFGPCNS